MVSSRDLGAADLSTSVSYCMCWLSSIKLRRKANTAKAKTQAWNWDGHATFMYQLSYLKRIVFLFYITIETEIKLFHFLIHLVF